MDRSTAWVRFAALSCATFGVFAPGRRIADGQFRCVEKRPALNEVTFVNNDDPTGSALNGRLIDQFLTMCNGLVAPVARRGVVRVNDQINARNISRLRGGRCIGPIASCAGSRAFMIIKRLGRCFASVLVVAHDAFLNVNGRRIVTCDGRQ